MTYDILIKNGTIVDGTGKPSFSADIGILEDRIQTIGNLSNESAKVAIDASNLAVAPGFIDIHNHSDFTVYVNPKAESYIRQGCTTLVVGNCGFSCYPIVDAHMEELKSGGIIGYLKGFEIKWHSLAEYRNILELTKIGINVAPLVGHGAIRTAVMGFEPRGPTSSELRDMEGLLAKAMQDGAFGFSTGLEYAPGSYSDTYELVALNREMKRYGGFYATHTRNRNEGILEAANEAMQIAREAGVPLQISHHLPRFPMEGLSKQCLKEIDAARSSGLDVTIDVFAPYTTEDYLHDYMWGSTTLTAMLPKEALQGGVRKLLERLRDRAYRDQLKNYDKPIFRMGARRYGQWNRILVEYSQHTPELVGKSIADIAREKNQDPWDVVFDILLANGEDCLNCFMTGASYSKKDGIEILRYPWTSVGSDGIALATYGDLYELRFQSINSYSCFPVIFERYVRLEKVLTLEEAVRKCTSLPAKRLGIQDRGIIEEGLLADIVIFNPSTVRAESTLIEPRKYPIGIEYVIVNGKLVIQKEKHTEELPGKVLARPESH